LKLLLEEGYAVTTLVRREAHAAQIREHFPGADFVMGPLDDGSLIRKHTAAVLIVILAEAADPLQSVEAVLETITKRAERGESTIYVHTSGTSELVDNSRGMFASEAIYTNKDAKSIVANVSDTARHRAIDLAILEARKESGRR